MLNWKGLNIEAEGEGISSELSNHVNLLGTLVGHAVRVQAGEEVYNSIESFRVRLKESYKNPKEDLRAQVMQDMKALKPDQIDWLLRAFKAFFHLINKAEQEEIIRINRKRDLTSTPGSPRAESIFEAIHYLKENKFSIDEVTELLASIDIQPTLTAHPTEARRRSVLYIQNQISKHLSLLSRQDLSENEKDKLVTAIYNQIVLLLNTDDVRSTEITVRDEIRNGLFFFISTIWDVVPDIIMDIENGVERYYDKRLEIKSPIKYRSWIGGDRDGNPKVTTDVTRFAIVEQRSTAIELYRRTLLDLRRELSISDRQVNVPEYFRSNVLAEVESIGLPIEVANVYKHELYRLKINCIIEKLKFAEVANKDGALSQSSRIYTVEEFQHDIDLIHKSLVETGFSEIAQTGLLRRIRTQIRTFGFSLAALDIRQHSDLYGSAVDELLRHASVSRNYLQLEEAQKIDILMQELTNPRPLVPISASISDDSRAILNVLNLVRKSILVDVSSIGSLIISMTHHVSHLLEVMLLCKETGLWQYNEGNVHSMVDIVPLFETVDDLERSGELMKALYENPIYEQQLKARGNFQEIMLGYSDSNKDGGYWMANWALHKGQKDLAEVSAAYNIELRLFHGRGGTVGRGGGRANQAVTALPPECHNGKIRFTEQGEVISFRYANKNIAHRHLEQVVNAMIKTTASYKRKLHKEVSAPDKNYADLMEVISVQSMSSYRKLIDHPEFWKWYTTITPIEHISNLPIASRPISRKSSNEVDFDSLRAIPWVFAWTQVRYNVPGWYGVGSALYHVVENDKARLEDLKKLYKEWSFFKAVVNNAQREMARANLFVSTVYGSKMESPFHGIIQAEFERTEAIINEIVGQDELLGINPVIKRSIQLRNPYTDVLNLLQIEMMQRWKNPDDPDREALRRLLFSSINGIAAAMQSTG